MNHAIRSWAAWLLAGVLAVHLAHAPAAAEVDGGEDAAMADGRALSAQFLAGEVGPIWERFSEPMRAAIGTQEALAGFSEQVAGQLGEEQSVLRETVEPSGEISVYRRVGRWSLAPMPIAITWAMVPGGRIDGFQVSPAAPEEFAGPATPQEPLAFGTLPSDAGIRERLRAFVEESGAAPGVIAAVLDQEGPRFVAWGDAGDGRPPDRDTVFEAGSITKGLTGLLLAQMISEGAVAADQSVGSLVPEGVKLAPEIAAITLEDLATHRSGLPRLGSGPEMQARMTTEDPYNDSTPEEIFADVARVDPAAVAAGRGRFAYSNLGVALLGQLLALAAEQPFDAALAERVFAPAGLPAPVLVPEAVDGRRAVGTLAGKPVPAWHLDAYAPTGAWQASAKDLLALAEVLLRAEPAWIAEALRRREVAGHPGNGMGLGWHHARVGDRDIVWHNGGTAGSSSFLAIVPAEGLAVAVLANGGGGVVDGLARSLLASGR